MVRVGSAASASDDLRRSPPLPAGTYASSASAGTAKPAEAEFDAAGVVPLDVRTRFAARLQRLSGMELGHVLQSIDQQCPEALEDPTEAQLRCV